MKTISKKTLMVHIAVFFLLSIFDYAYGNNGEKIIMKITPLQSRYCPAHITRKCTEILRDKLARSGIITVVDQKNQDASIDVKIEGKISRRVLAYGEEKKTRYVSQDLKAARYQVNVTGRDFHTGSIDCSFTRTAWGRNRYKAVEEVAEKIISYYQSKLEKPLPEVRYRFVFNYFSTSLRYIQAGGRFSEFAGSGIGTDLSITGRVVPFNRITLAGSLGCYFMESSTEVIKSMQILFPAAHAGYSWKFRKLRMLGIMPSIGFGYIIHIINGDSSRRDASGNYAYKRDYFFDPAVTFGCKVSLPVFFNYRLFAIPSYLLFFERNDRGNILSIAIGMSRRI